MTGSVPRVSRPAGAGGLIALGLIVSCWGPRGFEADRELLEATGATDLPSWRCEPDGPREPLAGYRRGQECFAEREHAGVYSTVRMRREPDGHVVSIGRVWSATDSAAWTRLHDSVSTALSARAGSARSCPTWLDTAADSARFHLGADGVRHTAHLWRLTSYDLGLWTSQPPPVAGRFLWSMNVDAARYGMILCGRERRPPA